METIFSWDLSNESDKAVASCTIYYKRKPFLGVAYCHPQDKDFCSEKTGSAIAEMRAQIKLLTHIRDNELRPAYNAINHLYSSLSQGLKYNENSHEFKVVRRELFKLKNQLDTVSKEIVSVKKSLSAYISEKDKFYKKVRKDRKR